MTWSRLSVCLLLLSNPCPGYGQGASPGPNPPGLGQSLESLDALVDAVPNAPPVVSFAKFRLRTVLAKLQRLSASWPAASPADYRANMFNTVETLKEAVAAGQPARLAAILEAIADDLEVKLEHCQNSGGTLGGSVTVNVRTVQGAREISNWQVFYLPKVLDVLGGATPDRFPKLSSPTLESLVPGRYVMWVGSPDAGLTSEKTIVKVGEGRKELDLDLLVPADGLR